MTDKDTQRQVEETAQALGLTPIEDDPYEIIRRAIGEALDVIRPERSRRNFTAIRWLHSAQRAVERLAAEAGKEKVSDE